MKKLLVLIFGCLMMFLTSSVLACENCDCGCQNGEKCKCKKEIVKEEVKTCPDDCKCGCHQGEKCTCKDCKCKCHKKCNCTKDCNCGCQNGEKCTCKDCACSKDCKCGCKKNKKSLKNIFKRNKIKCNCEE